MRILVVSARFFVLPVLLYLLSACDDGEKGAADNDITVKVKTPAAENVWSVIPLPELADKPVNLRVANIVNSRFRQLSSSQVAKILARSQQLIKKNFGIDVVYSPVETVSIAEVFNSLPAGVIAARKKEIVDIDSVSDDKREHLQQALFKTLSGYSDSRAELIAYAQPYLLQPEVKHKDLISLSYALADTLIARLRYWKTQTASDGKPVLDGSGYNEWVWWDSLGYGDLPYDVVITNQLVASAENYGMDVHSSLRGGLSAGTTTYNKKTRFNSYAFIMVYPMINDTELLTTLRQDEHYSEQQVINYSAALLTHEIGHLLLHIGHPFGNKYCVMSPTTMLNYRRWYDGLDVAQCRLNSSPEMTPAVVQLEYNPNW